MDTFGRLPDDVINIINQFYQLPSFDIIHKDRIQLQITYRYGTHDIDLCPPLYDIDHNGIIKINDEDLHDIYLFIENLREHNPCEYKRGIMHIIYDNDIKIHQYNNKIVLHNDCLDMFINVMQKYYDILNMYPKWVLGYSALGYSDSDDYIS